ncbi:hypothetical protein CRYUN_Cryun12cG0006300 [Craigia yunnanensis]
MLRCWGTPDPNNNNFCFQGTERHSEVLDTTGHGTSVLLVKLLPFPGAFMPRSTDWRFLVREDFLLVSFVNCT